MHVRQPYFATSFIDPAIRKFCTPLKVEPSIKEKRYGLDYAGGFVSGLSLWGKQSGHVEVVSKTWVSVTPSVIFHSSFATSSVRLYKKPESTLYTPPTRQSIAKYSSATSQADTTALRPSVFVTAVHKLLAMNNSPSAFSVPAAPHLSRSKLFL